ncbi:MAG: hypothetical protein PVI04_09260, partial [Anaerolineales bacterium]
IQSPMKPQCVIHGKMIRGRRARLRRPKRFLFVFLNLNDGRPGERALSIMVSESRLLKLGLMPDRGIIPEPPAGLK